MSELDTLLAGHCPQIRDRLPAGPTEETVAVTVREYVESEIPTDELINLISAYDWMADDTVDADLPLQALIEWDAHRSVGDINTGLCDAVAYVFRQRLLDGGEFTPPQEA
jgi:hypothetical protein